MPELPKALPPAERTVGQLIAETIRAYGDNFWRALPLGVPIALSTQVSLGHSANVQTIVLLAFTPLVAASFLRACQLVHGTPPTVRGYFLAILIFAPVPFLVRLIVLPAVAWLALFGLAVPASLVEHLPFRAALERGRRLAVADYVHALGSLAAAVIVVGVAELTLIALLRSQGESGQRVAHGLADVVLTPMLYLCGALLYVDQAARIGSRRPDRRSRADADLHPVVDTDPARRPDPQIEP
jgi:hypothetical protein